MDCGCGAFARHLRNIIRPLIYGGGDFVGASVRAGDFAGVG